jgi:hypothetical protein
MRSIIDGVFSQVVRSTWPGTDIVVPVTLRMQCPFDNGAREVAVAVVPYALRHLWLYSPPPPCPCAHSFLATVFSERRFNPPNRSLNPWSHFPRRYSIIQNVLYGLD